MERLRHAIRIDRPLQDVYALARQVENYPAFLPGYTESRIIDERDGRYLLARAAIIDGKTVRWKSWVWFSENQRIDFEQSEGPLKGMRVRWEFSGYGDWTQVVITHQFAVSGRLVFRRFFEKFVFKPKIDRIASAVVLALKRACESREEVPA